MRDAGRALRRMACHKLTAADLCAGVRSGPALVWNIASPTARSRPTGPCGDVIPRHVGATRLLEKNK